MGFQRNSKEANRGCAASTMGESRRPGKEMNALILSILICICVALYAVWRSQLEMLRVLRQINIKALNAALFLRSEPAPDAESNRDDHGKPN